MINSYRNLVFLLAVGLVFPISAFAQTNGPATHSQVTLDSGTDATPNDDFTIFPFQMDNGQFLLGILPNRQGASALAIQDVAPIGSFSLSENGVGIGLSGFDGDQSRNAQAPLHVVGGGVPGPFQTEAAFSNAQIFIDDRADSGEGFKQMIRMQANNPLFISMTDTSFGDAGANYALNNESGNFYISDEITGNIPLFIGAMTPHNLLNLDPMGGVGINTSEGANATPVAAMLHVTADGSGGPLSMGNNPLIRAEANIVDTPMDRTLVDLRNNGKVKLDFLDTAEGATTGYNIQVEQSSGRDRMRFEKTGGDIRASAAFFGDGHVRYSVNGRPNFTVKPNGDLNIIGQAPDAFGNGGAAGGNVSILGYPGNATTPATPGNLRVTGDARILGTIFGQLSGSSDRNAKENIQAVDPQEVLSKVLQLPIATWNYKKDKSDTPHMGPMAQDFHAAFKLGDNNKRIYSMDKDGVALAAIQGLHESIQAKDKKIADLRNVIAELQEATESQAELTDELTARLERLETLVSKNQ